MKLMQCIHLAVLFTVLTAVASAQAGSGLELDRLSSTRAQTPTAQLLTSEQVPLDNVVEPETYRVGPGDVLAYTTSTLDFSEKMVVISPENKLLLERYGLVDVRDLTLAQVRDSVASIIKRRASNVEVYLTLRRPRLIYVTVQGNVPYPGTYTVPASMRVSTFLNVTRQPWLLRKDAAVGELARTDQSAGARGRLQEVVRTPTPALSGYALRNITVRHQKGSSSVDLALARLTGQASMDPHLREGDLVMVPFDQSTPSVSIAGAVATALTLPWKEGDRASMLLAACGGAGSGADLSRVTLVQPGGGGKTTLKVDADLAVIGEDPLLQPGASIVVEREVLSGERSMQGVVQISGEVHLPGSVVIQPGVTTLRQAVTMAGGLTDKAALSLAYVARPDVDVPPYQHSMSESYRSFQYSDLTLEDTLRYRLDQMFRLPYVSCDFVHAFSDSSSSDNITLQNGDIIVIPTTPDRVYVYGQVSQPGYVAYRAGQTLDWYVDQAGGYATGAKEARARIIKGKTKVWVEEGEGVVVYPGDEVYVPRAPDVPRGTELQTWAIVAGIVSSIVALTATVMTLATR